MPKQKFPAVVREAIWRAHNEKCAYTGQQVDLDSLHIDHIIPERLADNPEELSRVLADYGLPPKFDVNGYANLLPARGGVNLRKAEDIFSPETGRFFLEMAGKKKTKIEENIERLERAKNRSRALFLLQRQIENGSLAPEDVAKILAECGSRPQEIFTLLEGLKFSDKEEIWAVSKSEIEELKSRPIVIGDYKDGLSLYDDQGREMVVKSCRDYDAATKDGYYARDNVTIKASSLFEHQCGLLSALAKSTIPRDSYLGNPRVGITDLALLPISLFPCVDDERSGRFDPDTSYQTQVSQGGLVVQRVTSNSLTIQELEGMGQVLIEAARADFNGDGLEDILVLEYVYATHGTLGYGGTMVLTRTSPNARFERIP